MQSAPAYVAQRACHRARKAPGPLQDEWLSCIVCVWNGRALEEMFLCYGARIGYWRGKIEGVQDDLHVSPSWQAAT